MLFNLFLGLTGAAVIVYFTMKAWQAPNGFKATYLITLPENIQVDPSEIAELSKAAKWHKIRDGQFKGESKISEEALRKLVSEAYSDVPEKDIKVYNAYSGYFGM
ncbi:hypothetical protein [Ileibacterium valens]|uniref:Uncharacterized protein n=1 Tax=Ileibacterium valens TaxID=1862668 RepID=A0A1U7NG54_9FIRM|nr:hypothetical protein [Ileibacterium valens]OLU39406.1 hypothetical protein BM735_07390 [Erysipelotrichaceae bacterium NYU-BL-F16]OLU39607.1 hypothetical protein BO222_06310 [Ileibacterium valens]OLU40504.1 hypothetical protein BO224_05325 [Erysipelotrichaceae bacterium NYU-BL-E8]